LGMEKIMVINPPDRDDFVSRLRAKIVSS
jgi:hypothetical protein